MSPPIFRLLSLFFLLLSSFSLSHSSPSPPSTVCIIGSGIAGSSVAHFLRTYSPLTQPNSPIGAIHIFERNAVVGGRMATINLAGEIFEAGASILHPKNYHANNFTQLLGLRPAAKKGNDDSLSLGIWDGTKFAFKTLTIDNWKYPILQKIVDQINSLRLFWRYGVSLLRMDTFIENTLDKFLKYYENPSSRPVFETAEEMLEWSGLYNLTGRSLEEEVLEAGLSPLLVQELVTVITRINYGQSVRISGLAGAVSMAGSNGGLWAVEGGNWQMAAGLIATSDVDLHLNEEIASISHVGRSYEGFYELDSTSGNSYACDIVVVATPLDELNIQFNPLISVPERKMQHTFTTFIRGLLNPAYFGLAAVSEIPEIVGTLEDTKIPFSSISVLKKHGSDEFSYKVFSREPLDDALLDQIFSLRKETIKIDWAAYPHYSAPESFAPFLLDGLHLYYVNAFESAASTMETSAVSAENIARLILSRLSNQPFVSSLNAESSLDEDL
ncbi:hypothetical protein V2J09_007807 [Rumex salicifolius]